jgi:hypothetical protein
MANAGLPGTRFPTRADDTRHRPQGDFPILNPRFKFTRGDTVFTIGSCFARNIEEHLEGFRVPTRDFSVPKDEWPTRANGLLNEFNPGTISQRILAAITHSNFGDSAIGNVSESQWIDLLLCGGGTPVSRERLLERRAEVDAVYSALPGADVVIITLGLVEAWFDRKSQLYLNQWPKIKALNSDADRYCLHRLDPAASYALLERAIAALIHAGVNKILLTLSPVPLQATFAGQDCIVANSYSKAVLRVCAEQLVERFPQVDYFPSYEIVTSLGRNNFDPADNVHVRLISVIEVVKHMLAAYVDTAAVPEAIASQKY